MGFVFLVQLFVARKTLPQDGVPKVAYRAYIVRSPWSSVTTLPVALRTA